MIERTHRVGEALGLAVWNQDEAGPDQMLPFPGARWQPAGELARRPHA